MTPPDPFAAEHTSQRRSRLRAVLDQRFDEQVALVVSDPINVRYLSGFHGSHGFVVLDPDGGCRLFTDSRYAEQARSIPQMAVEVGRHAWHDVVIAALADHDRVVFEGGHVTVAEHEVLLQRMESADRSRCQSGHDLVQNVRQTKDDAEIAALEQACGVAEAALDEVLARIAVGDSEHDIAADLLATMRRLGAEGEAFAPIVAAGSNAAEPHHHPSARPVARGELLKIDFGAVVAGYHSDITRTFVVGAEPDSRQREIHSLVAEAQARGRAAVAGGVPIRSVDAAAREYLDRAGYGKAFSHGLGHGVGLQIHEAPLVSGASAGTLESCMTITVEPGLYLPDWGGVRIEDTVLVTVDGHRSLSQAPRDLLSIG